MPNSGGWNKKRQIGLLALYFAFLTRCAWASESTGVNHEVAGFVHISDRNITTLNNRNLTIICYADLSNRTELELSFSTDARMVLTFMSKPREAKPLHQMQSFLHCLDPNRKNCLAEFNFDISCLEDQMNQSYIRAASSYRVEAACQVDDSNLCSRQWMVQHPLDCYDLGQVTVVSAPKLGERCVYGSEKQALECGYHQVCSTMYGICMCESNYVARNRRCQPLHREESWSATDRAELLERSSSSSVNSLNTESVDPSGDEEIEESDVKLAGSNNTFKAIVIFLLVVAILLCIALGIVIIWSRHYRRLLEDMNNGSGS